MDAKTDPSNPVLAETLEKLDAADGEIYDTAEKHLGKTNRQRPEVNISTLERHSEDGKTLLVPGKVLGSGILDSEVSVAAFKFSKKAKQKISSEGGQTMYIQELLEEDEEGSEVKIVV